MPNRFIYKLPSVVLLGVLLGVITSCGDEPDAEQDESGVLEQTESGAESLTQPQTSDLAPLPDAIEDASVQERPPLDLHLPESVDPIPDETLDFYKQKPQPDYFATENQKPEEKKKLAVGARVISDPSRETHYEEWVKDAEVKIEIQTGQEKSKN